MALVLSVTVRARTWITAALAIAMAVSNVSAVPAEPTPVDRLASVTRFECVSDEVVELEVTSADPFPVRNALTELDVGAVVSMLSRYPDGGDLHTLIFTLARDDLASISPDDTAFVRYNPSNGQDVWPIGPLGTASCDLVG